MSISNEERDLDDDFIVCVAIILIIIIRSRQLQLQKEYDDDHASEDADSEDVEEEEEDELTSEDAHCEDLEDGVEVTSCRKRSNLALEGRDIAGGDNIDKVTEGSSSHQKRGRCTSSESDFSARKEPPTGDLVKEKSEVEMCTTIVKKSQK